MSIVGNWGEADASRIEEKKDDWGAKRIEGLGPERQGQQRRIASNPDCIHDVRY
jgi:hypothetical protein